MDVIHYVGLDVHKQTVSFCVKRPDGRIVSEDAVSADRTALGRRLGELPQPGRFPDAAHPLNPYWRRIFSRGGYRKAVVAVAARLARILWAM